MVRDDLHGFWQCPSDVEDYLARVGGRNPFGENMYRLIVAESRYMKIAGCFRIWDTNIPVAERDGMTRATVELEKPEPVFGMVGGKQKIVKWVSKKEMMVEAGHKPLREEIGIKEVQRYDGIEGFILERWYPAECYGTKEQWHSLENCLPDGTPMLGEYPSCGDYEGIYGPWPTRPGTSVLAKGIAFAEDKIQNQHDTPEGRTRKRLNRALAEYDKSSKKFRDDMFHMIKDKSSFLESSSLEAGRLRTEFGERAGIRHHIGN
jgi:hypothetical protein